MDALILNGHIDTVEVGDPSAWSHAHWAGTSSTGASYGRGACDMKGGIVANLFAVRALGWRDCSAGDVIVEHDLRRGRWRRALAAVLRGYIADGALISEPTNLAIDRAGWGADVPATGSRSLSACLRSR